MEYTIITLLIIILIISIITLTKNINEGAITERIGKLETGVVKELGDFKNGFAKDLYDDFEKLNEKLDYKLKKLVDSGQIQEYLNGNDEIEKKLPVYKEEDGEIIETYTDAYGYPNLTIDGYVMYENEYFKSKIACKKYAIKCCVSGIDNYNRYIQQKLKEIEELTVHINSCQRDLKKLLKD